MSSSCAVHMELASTVSPLTMEKAVQWNADDDDDIDEMTESEKENLLQMQITQADDAISDGPAITESYTPFSVRTQGAAPFELQSQPIVEAILEEKQSFHKNMVGKTSENEMSMEILDYSSQKENRLNPLNLMLNPLVPKPVSLVTVIKFQNGEFVKVKSAASYNSSMYLPDMKKALSAALDSCIEQSSSEEAVVPSLLQSSPRQVKTANNVEKTVQENDSINPKTAPSEDIIEGNTGTNEDMLSTSDDKNGHGGSSECNNGSKQENKGSKETTAGLKGSKGVNVESKAINAGLKGIKTGLKSKNAGSKGGVGGLKRTNAELKGTSEPTRVSKRTPEKSKEERVPNDKPAPSAKVDTKPEKPAPLRVKKMKVPDEESLKFAARQREIQRMKKELKERLKREGKNGVDPAARINAWGRTVGVTCTMCGNHVQKSYGCFRRDTAPSKLLHLFTPGMNRIKICRRCLPYKKQPGKNDLDNRVSKPGLLSLPNDHRGVNSGNNSPSTISPIPDKQVTAATLNAIHRKVTGQEATNTAQLMLVPSHMGSGLARVTINADHVSTPAGLVTNQSGPANNPAGIVANLSGHILNVQSLVNNGSGLVNTNSGHVNSESVRVNTDSVHVNTGSGHVVDPPATCLAADVDLSGESRKGSAIEYIRKLALDLQTNYSSQQNSNMASKTQQAVTPQDQIIKTPVYEHLSNFTPVTPSMTLTANEMTKNASIAQPGVQWKPVSNEVTPAGQTITPVDGPGKNVAPTPPWKSGSVVLKTQPNVLLTPSGQVSHDQKRAALQAFVTTTDQRDLKLLPAIMETSRNALQQNGPLVVQVQRIKLVRDKILGVPASTKMKTTTLGQGQPNEILAQSGFTGTNFISCPATIELPQQISRTEVENSISNFLSQPKQISPLQVEAPVDDLTKIPTAQVEPSYCNFADISSAQVEAPAGNFQSLTGEFPSNQAEASTVDLQSIAGELSSSQVETSTSDIQKITEEIASLIETAGEFVQESSVKMMDTVGNSGTEKDIEYLGQDQPEKPLQDLNAAVEKAYHLGEQTLSSEGIEMNDPQPEPSVALCGSANTASGDSSASSIGYKVIDENDCGQGGLLETPTYASPSTNKFISQISEEHLPERSVEQAIESSEDNVVKKADAVENSSVCGNPHEGIVNDVRNVISEASISNVSENKHVTLHESEIKDSVIQGDCFEAAENDTTVDMNVEADEAETTQKGKRTPQKDSPRKSKTNSSSPGNMSEKQTKVKDPKVENSLVTDVDGKVLQDLRRSQRRAASPKKGIPCKSPAKNKEAKVHSTRQQRQKDDVVQKVKVGSLVTQKDKAGQQGPQRDKVGSQVTQKDKVGSHSMQKGKTERHGIQEDKNEPEGEQGVKRKRQGRGTKPAKLMKQ